MVSNERLTRRNVLALIPACALAVYASSSLRAEPVSSPARPVLRVSHTGSEASAATLVEAMRRAPGCLRVDAYGVEGDGVALVQTWRSVGACDAFWADRPGAEHGPVFQRLEI